MRVTDGQSDFSGGMVDRIAPERLAPNQYAYGKNVEIRDGGIRSRRGSWLLAGNAKNADTTVAEVVGSMIYRSPVVGETDTLIVALYHSDTNATTIHYSQMPAMDIRTELDLPEALIGRHEMRIVQAYDKVYFLRHAQRPMEWDGDFDEGITYVEDDSVLGAAPLARDGAYIFNRLWLVDGDDTVIPSDLLSAAWDTSTNEFRVEQGDGTRLVVLKPFAGGSILALKQRAIAIILGASNFTDAGDLSVEFVSDRVGCVAPDTAVQIGGDVFFLGGDGVWTAKQTSEQNAQLVEVPLSESIKGLINDINWLAAEKSTAVQYDNYYLLAVPVGGAVIPNRILAFDLLNKVWVGFWEYPEAEEVDDDELFKHAKLAVARIGAGDLLLTIGRYGSVGVLCKGDTQDWVGTIETDSVYLYSDAGLGEFVYTDGESAVSDSEFWASDIGQVEATIRVDENDEIDIMVLQLLKQAGGPSEETVPFFRVYTSGSNVIMAARWQAAGPDDFTYTMPVDKNWHKYGIYSAGYTGSGYLVCFTIDGKRVATTLTGEWMPEFSPYDPFWEWVPPGDIGLSWCGITKGQLRGFDHRNGWYSLYRRTTATGTEDRIIRDINTVYGSTDVRTVSVNRFAVDTDIDGRFVKVLLLTQAPGSSVSSTSYIDDDLVMPDADFEASIESVIKTRGMWFDDIMSQKSGLRGELRFSHGQPSVTAELATDKPFDTETLTSLNAKTYSLTDYEVVGRTAWDPTNTNDDFATPYREDYAPIQFPIELGTNAIVLDKYREHTELFSSLASFGWVQFTLTNTQGFVRYNKMALRAQSRTNEQDAGNNGN